MSSAVLQIPVGIQSESWFLQSFQSKTPDLHKPTFRNSWRSPWKCDDRESWQLITVNQKEYTHCRHTASDQDQNTNAEGCNETTRQFLHLGIGMALAGYSNLHAQAIPMTFEASCLKPTLEMENFPINLSMTLNACKQLARMRCLQGIDDHGDVNPIINLYICVCLFLSAHVWDSLFFVPKTTS